MRIFRSVGMLSLLLGAATAAGAQTELGAVVDRLKAQGFSSFEVRREAGRVKVEAYRGTLERELVYDGATGRLLSDEISRGESFARGDDDGTPDQGRGDAGDDRRDDRGGDDRGGNGRDDRGGDDHGGHGRDDRGGDDHGGHGGDDRGGDDHRGRG